MLGIKARGLLLGQPQQLLVELDGFDTKANAGVDQEMVLVMGATNLSAQLDPALLRNVRASKDARRQLARRIQGWQLAARRRVAREHVQQSLNLRLVTSTLAIVTAIITIGRISGAGRVGV